MVLRVCIAVGCLIAVIAAWMMFQKPSEDPQKPIATDTSEEEPVLAVEKQEAIWEAEHATFEIETRFGKAFRDAWAAGDRERLAAFFLPDFKGSVVDRDNWLVTEKSPLQQRSRNTEVEGTKPASADEVISALLVLLDDLKSIERTKLRVLAIEAVGASEWDLRILMVAVSSADDTPVGMTQSEHTVRLRVEDEKALATAASIVSWHVQSETIRESEWSLLSENTAALGLSDLPLLDNWELPREEALQHRFQIAAEDFDRDGDPDLAITTVAGRRMLLRNTDGRFEDVTTSLGLPRAEVGQRYRFVTGWIDFDNDGYPDLLSGARLFHNEQGESFTDVTDGSGLDFDKESMGCTVVDYDNDGLLDLYLLYQRPFDAPPPKEAAWVDESGTGKSNQLWRNEGNGRFRNVTSKAKAGGGRRHTHAVAWLFYDEDHLPDLYIANDFGRNVLLRNRGDGTFEDVSDASGSGGFATSMGVVAGDVDNDGTSDLYVANMYSKMGRRIIGMVSDADYPDGMYDQIKGSCAGNRLYTRSSPADPYEDLSDSVGVNAVGWAWGPTMFDLDHDGWLDLYATTGFMSFDRKRPDG